MDLKPALYGLDRDEVCRIVKEAGAPAYRADQLLGWLYKKHITDFPEAKNLPAGFLGRLAVNYAVSSLEFAERRASENGESVKFIFRTRDGRLLESVLISQKDRKTVCVSTQLGCKMGCVFCASGKGRFGRGLTAGEIVEQVAAVERTEGTEATNVVFMGMGEPLDNFEPVMKALGILQAPWGFGIGARRITVSTVGLVPKIEEFVRRSEGRVRLSVSLHSALEETRSRLLPVSRRYPVKELAQALARIHRTLKREITFEYTLIEGVNDSPEEAAAVVRLARPLNAKVNIIPCNPILEENFRRPPPDKIEAFRVVLQERGVRVTVRQTAGSQIDAACGQLRLRRETAGDRQGA